MAGSSSSSGPACSSRSSRRVSPTTSTSRSRSPRWRPSWPSRTRARRPRRTGLAWRSQPKLRDSMIESLVEQIEARFADAQAQMSDPEVISDRERFAEAGRAFNRLAPAAKLGEEWRLAQPNLDGARELRAAGGEDPQLFA